MFSFFFSQNVLGQCNSLGTHFQICKRKCEFKARERSGKIAIFYTFSKIPEIKVKGKWIFKYE